MLEFQKDKLSTMIGLITGYCSENSCKIRGKEINYFSVTGNMRLCLKRKRQDLSKLINIHIDSLNERNEKHTNENCG